MADQITVDHTESSLGQQMEKISLKCGLTAATGCPVQPQAPACPISAVRIRNLESNRQLQDELVIKQKVNHLLEGVFF